MYYNWHCHRTRARSSNKPVGVEWLRETEKLNFDIHMNIAEAWYDLAQGCTSEYSEGVMDICIVNLSRAVHEVLDSTKLASFNDWSPGHEQLVRHRCLYAVSFRRKGGMQNLDRAKNFSDHKSTMEANDEDI